jgi:cold shock CspA family protein
VFIARADAASNTFCHASALKAAGIEADTGLLGKRVEFDVSTGRDGRQYAIDVELVD